VIAKKPLPPPLPNESWVPEQQNQDDATGYVRWTAEQAEQLREKSPSVSPWRVIVWQLVAGGLIAAVAWLISGEPVVAVSALYGALTVALPAAVLARGLTSPLGRLNAASSALSFMVWEMVKIALSVAMFLAAPALIAGLHWPALLVSLILTMKVYWLAAVYKPRPKKN
jgi:ATP synthase protein I